MSERILAGRYRLLEQIGSGGMAIVYKAEDLRTGHFVAVKLLRPDLAQNAEYVSRFQREAQAASKMTHHNIVNLLDVGMDGDSRYLVMEYVPGQTLKQVIQERTRLPAQTAAAVTIRILSALQHAHENGIIHRDIKPQNILVNEEGLIKVADFGIARIADTQTLSQSDTVMGSVHYFSPEQASGGETDERSDIYSVGVVLYEMLTGRVPFDADNQVSVAMLHLHGQPEPISTYAPDVPPAVAHVCMVAMNKNPDNRYQSAREMAADLRMALEGRMEVMQSHMLEGGQRSDRQLAAELGAHGKNGGRKVRRRFNWVWWTATALTALVVIAALVFGVSAIISGSSTRVTVPNFTGRTRAEAEELARGKGLTLIVAEANYDNVEAGLVGNQSLPADSTAARGDVVTVTLSLGRSLSAADKVPRVTGMMLDDAAELLQAEPYSLKVRPIPRLDDSPADMVLQQNPTAGSPIPADRQVTLYISGGSVRVPNLIGRTFSDAYTALQSVNLALSPRVEMLPTDNPSKRNTVATQSTQPDTALMEGEEIEVSVYVSYTDLKKGILTLHLPESDGQIAVRVTLEVGGGWVNVFEASYKADEEREQPVEITSWIEGTHAVRIYVNDVLESEDSVLLQ